MEEKLDISPLLYIAIMLAVFYSLSKDITKSNIQG